jgi:hypothetical protein
MTTALALAALGGCNEGPSGRRRRVKPDADVDPAWKELGRSLERARQERKHAPCVDASDVLSVTIAGGRWSVCQYAGGFDECLTIAPEGSIVEVVAMPEEVSGSIPFARERADSVEVCTAPGSCTPIAPALRPGETIEAALVSVDASKVSAAVEVVDLGTGWRELRQTRCR